MLTLRQYQEIARRTLERLVREGATRVCVVSPCGSGKTVLAVALIQDLLRLGGRVLFLAHRQELILQTSRKLDSALQPHGIIMAGNKRVAPSSSVQVASIPTIVRRLDRVGHFDFIIFDEAHHARCNTAETLFARWPTAPIIGLTATPERNDGRGLGELFHELLVVTSTRELIDQGYLVDYRAWVFDSDALDALDDVRVVDGDFDREGAAKVMGQRAVVGAIVEEWANRSAGRRSLYFATSVDRSKELVVEFNALRQHGGPVCYAEHIDASATDAERLALMGPGGRLERGETTLLANVGILLEGTDLPCIETIGLAAPTLSWSRAVQMIGRGFRPSPLTGKADLLILDHARCILMHGRPDDPREFTLSPDRVRRHRPKKQDFREMHACAKCGCIYPEIRARCGECGEPNPGWTPASVQHLDTDRVLEIRRAPTDAESKRARFLQLVEEQRRSRRRAGFAVQWFTREFGHEPAVEWLAE